MRSALAFLLPDAFNLYDILSQIVALFARSRIAYLCLISVWLNVSEQFKGPLTLQSHYIKEATF